MKMFGRLKRIEELMKQFVANEAECLKIVKQREVKYLLDRAVSKTPWKCEWPDCVITAWHIHTIAESTDPKVKP